MKLQDKLNLSISFVALAVSIFTAASDKIANAHKESIDFRKYIYNAYHLGQYAGIIYAFARSDRKNPMPDGTISNNVASNDVEMWTFATQAYAQSFQVAPDRFIAFRNQLVTSQPTDVTTSFSQLNSSILVSAGPKAVAAYELGWQTIVVAIGFINTSSSVSTADYPKLRARIESDLTVIGINYSMPVTVVNGNDLVAAMRDVIKVLNQLPSH